MTQYLLPSTSPPTKSSTVTSVAASTRPSVDSPVVGRAVSTPRSGIAPAEA